MSLVKTIDKGDEIVKLFNHPLLGGEKVVMGDKTYWMMVEKKTYKVKRHKSDDYVPNTTKKICGNCMCEKSVDEFPKDSYSSDGYHLRCMECNRTIKEKIYDKGKRLRNS